jgi:hypothetical protein
MWRWRRSPVGHQAQWSTAGQAKIHQARISRCSGKKDEAIACTTRSRRARPQGRCHPGGKLQQMIGVYQMMASMPQKDGNPEQQSRSCRLSTTPGSS